MDVAPNVFARDNAVGYDGKAILFAARKLDFADSDDASVRSFLSLLVDAFMRALAYVVPFQHAGLACRSSTARPFSSRRYSHLETRSATVFEVCYIC